MNVIMVLKRLFPRHRWMGAGLSVLAVLVVGEAVAQSAV